MNKDGRMTFNYTHSRNELQVFVDSCHVLTIRNPAKHGISTYASSSPQKTIVRAKFADALRYGIENYGKKSPMYV